MVIVTDTIKDAAGAPVASALVVFLLDRVEVDGTYVVPMRVETTCDANGVFSLSIWPNARGSTASLYTVRAYHPVTKKKLLEVSVSLPDVAGPIVLNEYAMLPPYPGKSDAHADKVAAQEARLGAEAAQAAAELAEDGAQAAQAAAETARTGAETARTGAETAEAGAQAAQTAAETARTGAETARTGAQAAQAAAELALDSFDDRYLGSKTDDPTLDNDGNALLTGALYWNSTADRLKVYSGSAWVDYVQDAADEASAAAASASAAATSESNAAASASAAQTARMGAEAAETNAEAAQAAAEAARNAAQTAQAMSEGARDAAVAAKDAAETAWDSFDDRYLGPKAANPSTDNDGNALLTGALYWNTGAGEMRVWDGATWQTAYVLPGTYLAVTTQVVSDLTALKALTAPSTARTVYMLGRASAGDGGQGFFRWVSGDQSANVSADTQAGIYVPPDSDTTGASGCWVRQHDGVIDLRAFGGVPDNSTDSADALESATVMSVDSNGRVIYKVRIVGQYFIGREILSNPDGSPMVRAFHWEGINNEKHTQVYESGRVKPSSMLRFSGNGTFFFWLRDTNPSAGMGPITIERIFIDLRAGGRIKIGLHKSEDGVTFQNFALTFGVRFEAVGISGEPWDKFYNSTTRKFNNAGNPNQKLLQICGAYELTLRDIGFRRGTTGLELEDCDNPRAEHLRFLGSRRPLIAKGVVPGVISQAQFEVTPLIGAEIDLRAVDCLSEVGYFTQGSDFALGRFALDTSLSGFGSFAWSVTAGNDYVEITGLPAGDVLSDYINAPMPIMLVDTDGREYLLLAESVDDDLGRITFANASSMSYFANNRSGSKMYQYVGVNVLLRNGGQIDGISIGNNRSMANLPWCLVVPGANTRSVVNDVRYSVGLLDGTNGMRVIAHTQGIQYQQQHGVSASNIAPSLISDDPFIHYLGPSPATAYDRNTVPRMTDNFRAERGKRWQWYPGAGGFASNYMSRNTEIQRDADGFWAWDLDTVANNRFSFNMLDAAGIAEDGLYRLRAVIQGKAADTLSIWFSDLVGNPADITRVTVAEGVTEDLNIVFRHPDMANKPYLRFSNGSIYLRYVEVEKLPFKLLEDEVDWVANNHENSGEPYTISSAQGYPYVHVKTTDGTEVAYAVYQFKVVDGVWCGDEIFSRSTDSGVVDIAFAANATAGLDLWVEGTGVTKTTTVYLTNTPEIPFMTA